jgi:glycosyltransferase involved in cell wall biosynthesis
VCAGRLDHSKGQDVLLAALRRLPDQRLTILGDGPERAALEALADQLDVADRCCFRGEVPRAEVLEEMSRSLVTVVPSRREAFGFVAAESLACGTPVAGSETGGLPEIVRNGVEGWLAPVDDAEALATAITGCLVGGTRMQANARRRFEEAFELGGWVREVADWLESLDGAGVRA